MFRFLLFAVALPMFAQRLFTPADTVAVHALSEIAPSPDGKVVLFSVDGTLMKAGGGEPEAVAPVAKGAANVRWARNGSQIAYIQGDAVWTFDFRSGKANRVCDYRRSNSFLSKAGNMLAWSPDGSQIAFAGTLEPAPAPQDPIVITRILYKGRTSLSDNRRSHLYAVPAAGGTPKALTSGNFDEHSIDWGGDGREIIFLSNHERDPDGKLNYDIFAIDVKGGAIRQLTHTPGVEMDPKVSPDGKSVAYIATKRDMTTIDSVAEDAHAWVIPIEGGRGVELNAALDRRTSGVAWLPDGKRVVYLITDHGRSKICMTSVGGDRATSCEGRGDAQISALEVAPDGLVFAISSPEMAPEIVKIGKISTENRQISHENRVFSTQFSLSKPENVEFKSFDGTPIQGWLYPALGGSRGTSPMILSIHGGPHGGFGYAFNPQFQAYAARGYAVLAINPRGSSGYGQEFSDGCVNNWGGGDYKDLMAGVDHVLATHRNIDPNRVFVTGGSYGGFMTNWVITQTTRFRAAVAVASLSNLISFYATSLYQDLVHAEFDGFPWKGDNFATLWKWSPLAHVEHVMTPTMFLHGESDNDVHITQAEEMYTALRQRGIEAELVRYPREGHGFREAGHRVDQVERTLAWFDGHGGK